MINFLLRFEFRATSYAGEPGSFEVAEDVDRWAFPTAWVKIMRNPKITHLMRHQVFSYNFLGGRTTDVPPL